VPVGIEFETVVIRKLRSWMYNNKLSSEAAFDLFCRTSKRMADKTLSRHDFHEALCNNDVGLSAAQTDALFTLLVGSKDRESMLNLRLWQTRVYEDGDNPLQMMRDIVGAMHLSQDDLLF
jgi:hypothetical protein